MKEQIHENQTQVKITRAAMEEELGDAYKRCWALAFKYASEGLSYDNQVDNICREFDLFQPQAQWFVNGANSILFQKDRQIKSTPNKESQKDLTKFPKGQSIKPSENHVSQLEMLSFLEDIEELSNDSNYSEFWDDLDKIKQRVVEQCCATEKVYWFSVNWTNGFHD